MNDGFTIMIPKPKNNPQFVFLKMMISQQKTDAREECKHKNYCGTAGNSALESITCIKLIPFVYQERKEFLKGKGFKVQSRWWQNFSIYLTDMQKRSY